MDKDDIQAAKKNPSDVKELQTDTLQHADSNQIADKLTSDGSL